MTDQTSKPKIFVFINAPVAENWYAAVALTQDGEFIAHHVSSTIEWSKHDMGITSDWKHEKYDAHYPDGYELEWVDGDVREHAGVKAAYELHCKKHAAGKEIEGEATTDQS